MRVFRLKANIHTTPWSDGPFAGTLDDVRRRA
jgi:hypothetical protein